MTPFFVPAMEGRAGEYAYQELRRLTELSMGHAPSERRIMELWTRRGNRDCVTTVGAPDPIRGGVVKAIFDMGSHQPFVVYREDPTDPLQHLCEVLGPNAYSVSEFAG
jgi:hypothetical protein